MGKILAVGNHPDRHNVSLVTRRFSEDSTDLELESEGAGLASPARPRSSRVSRSNSHRSAEKPSATKKTALNRPTGWVADNK